MSTTTSYGTWQNHTSELSLRNGIEDALGVDEHGNEAEYRDAVEADYRTAINAALPEGVSLAGDEFYGPHPLDGMSYAKAHEAISTAIDGVDFWAIAERHAK